MRSTAWQNCVRTSPPAGEAARPAHDQRRAHAAEPGVALPQPQRRVARPGPAPRRSGCRRGSRRARRCRASVSSTSSTLVVGEAVLVERADRAALGAGAVVGEHQHQRVVEPRRARSRQSSTRPICASVWVRKPANTSIMRANRRRCSAGSAAQAGIHGGRSVERRCRRARCPSAIWRAKARARHASQPSSKRPR